MIFVVTVLKPVYSESGAATAPSGRHYDMEPVEEQAFLTLDKAREYVLDKRPGYATTWLTEKGGYIGPDDDGVCIEANVVDWGYFGLHEQPVGVEQQILDNFNEGNKEKQR